ncbi:uncharacterized protein VTP21DRAFT_5648 [Calcarisporiella thermophila]|uniref:uncharacterized protein n=1 Tax=Calcarisporiella thermophila TaxID=911321 RepID=UPI0037434AA0
MFKSEVPFIEPANPHLVTSQPEDVSSIVAYVASSPDVVKEFHEEDSNSYDCLFSADALRFQLRLNSLTDLYRLLSAQYITENKPLFDLPFQFQLPNYIYESEPIRRCTYFKIRSSPEPFENNEFRWTKKSTTVKRRLTDYLFHIYASGCVTRNVHPNPASFLESYYHNELEPALVHTAVALSAIHLLLAHPQTPIRKQLHSAIGSLLVQAKQSLEDAFDTPSPQIVIAYLNMDSTMTWLARFEDAYTLYSQAALMALTLQMDKDDSSMRDPFEIEFRRRIWTKLCHREMFYRFGFDKPELISLDLVIRSPKPTVMNSDRVLYKLTLVYILTGIQFNVKLLEFRDIDWSLSDDLIIQQLVGIAAFLQRDHKETLKYCGENIAHNYHLSELHCNFWTDWCNLWRQFIKSDAPPGRLETDLMQQMREKALEEFIKGLFKTIAVIEAVIRSQCWCDNYPLLNIHSVCENTKLIVRIHSDIKIRRQIFQRLVQVLEALKSLENKGVLEQWIACQIISVLEQIRSDVFSAEELGAMHIPKLRRIAVKSSET